MKTIRRAALGLALSSLGAAAAGAGAASHGPVPGARFLALVAEARGRVTAIDAKTLSQKLAAGEKMKIIDVREDSEWSAGHIPHALHLSRGVIERDIESAAPNLDEALVLYCGAGARSILAADSLQKMGYRRVYTLDGGLRAWLDAGNDQETSAEAPPRQ